MTPVTFSGKQMNSAAANLKAGRYYDGRREGARTGACSQQADDNDGDDNDAEPQSAMMYGCADMFKYA